MREVPGGRGVAFRTKATLLRCENRIPLKDKKNRGNHFDFRFSFFHF